MNKNSKVMRQIEREAVKAFEEGRNWKKGNMEVEVVGGDKYVYLFGNCIVWKSGLTGTTSYSHCGWHTMTTASRLRAFGADAHIVNGKLVIR